MRDDSPASSILSKAETELRALIEGALAEGRYGEVARLARLADGLAHLSTMETVGDTSTVPFTKVVDLSPIARPPDRTALRAPRLSRSRNFPRFEREGDKLVKIAWSKRDGAEYEHKAPRRIVDLLLASVRARKGEGARFVAPDVLPLKDARTHHEVPSYQSYLALAWLRHEGVITKYGRDGYALKPAAATAEHLSELWEALPSRG